MHATFDVVTSARYVSRLKILSGQLSQLFDIIKEIGVQPLQLHVVNITEMPAVRVIPVDRLLCVADIHQRKQLVHHRHKFHSWAH